MSDFDSGNDHAATLAGLCRLSTMTPVEATEVTLPAYWASALVNGDFSGLELEESTRCRLAIQRLAREGWSVASTVDNEEPRFTRHYRMYDPLANCEAGEVLDYVVLRAPRYVVRPSEHRGLSQVWDSFRNEPVFRCEALTSDKASDFAHRHNQAFRGWSNG